jgi:hypothetical protein
MPENSTKSFNTERNSQIPLRIKSTKFTDKDDKSSEGKIENMMNEASEMAGNLLSCIRINGY